MARSSGPIATGREIRAHSLPWGQAERFRRRCSQVKGPEGRAMIVKIGDEIDGVTIDTSAGGRLASWVMAGRERLLVEPAEGMEPSLGWGCYLMAPFVGRVRRGWVDWAGRKVRLRLNGGRHSIQGAVFDSEWTVVSRTAASATLSCPLDTNKWPFRGIVTQRIAIARGMMRLEAEIVADEPMPAALGWHPWFRNPGGHLCVGVRSDTVLALTPDLIPTGELVPVNRRTDLRAGPNLAGHHIDDVYAGVRSPVVVTWPDIELTMSFARPVGVAVVHTHPQAVSVGLATAWPDSIRLAAAGYDRTGLVTLQAGEKLTAAASCSWAVLPSVQPVRRFESRS
jgi:galactose mutarotase-like enzyme